MYLGTVIFLMVNFTAFLGLSPGDAWFAACRADRFCASDGTYFSCAGRSTHVGKRNMMVIPEMCAKLRSRNGLESHETSMKINCFLGKFLRKRLKQTPSRVCSLCSGWTLWNRVSIFLAPLTDQTSPILGNGCTSTTWRWTMQKTLVLWGI